MGSAGLMGLNERVIFCLRYRQSARDQRGTSKKNITPPQEKLSYNRLGVLLRG